MALDATSLPEGREKNLDTRKQQIAHVNTREAITHILAYHLKISHVFMRKVSITLRDFLLKSTAKIRFFFGIAIFFSLQQDVPAVPQKLSRVGIIVLAIAIISDCLLVRNNVNDINKTMI